MVVWSNSKEEAAVRGIKWHRAPSRNRQVGDAVAARGIVNGEELYVWGEVDKIPRNLTQGQCF